MDSIYIVNKLNTEKTFTDEIVCYCDNAMKARNYIADHDGTHSIVEVNHATHY